MLRLNNGRLRLLVNSTVSARERRFAVAKKSPLPVSGGRTVLSGQRVVNSPHVVGGKYKGEALGNGRCSHITGFSFHPVKIITTGKGGMASAGGVPSGGDARQGAA